MNPSQLESLTVQLLSVSRCDRWQASQRLQALSIPCYCSSDGLLVVEVDSPLDILQLRSVVHQLTASRVELIDWLERCWDTVIQ
ncbi:hypothetical protein J5X98_26460 [Leptothermofonsia sichuanensis E412]|uniref:Asr1405/Asl0597 family protein n=1 Tax=Leptothermofonsia sichuanensis TaxID=2917832 RepID=UPI001CA61DDD|nr:Asr1405/Asl0597 family protein [Leptothermofonsia sichuanensis]QZZ20722.1 hypothetical protein J5X98_26460 [Leptothermofonsia sichuanensis E412]